MTEQAPPRDQMTELLHFPSLEMLMEAEEGVPVRDDELIDLIFEYGRVMVLAPPGAGKSTMLERLGGISDGYQTISRSIPAVLATSAGGGTTGFRQWLLDIAGRPYGVRLLICLDGLDEISPSEGQEVLDGIEAVTSQDPQLAVVVADRVTRRAIQFDRWAFFGIASRGGQPSTAWNDLPFFRDGDVAGADNRSSAIYQMATRDSRGIDADFATVAGKAYAWLDQEDSTAAPSDQVLSLLGRPVLEALRDADLLTFRDDASQFRHVLYHAYFAAEHVRTKRDQWGEEVWNALTFDGANFLALGLLLETVDDADVDHLVRSVDRWNYLASASLLAEDLVGGGRISKGLRNALVLLLGHRRFSLNANTSLLAADLLRLQTDDDVANLVLRAESRADLVNIAVGLDDQSDWWRRWLDVFCSRDDEALVERLRGDDYLMAWTAANVLSGSMLDASAQDRLLELALDAASEDVRWRAIHGLGSARDPRVAERCLDAFRDDTDEWVRYGALRVFLQVVGQIEERAIRHDLCSTLAGLASLIQQNSRWEREIERAAELRDAPDDWPETFGLVIGALWKGSLTLEEEDRWRAAAAALTIDRNDPFSVTLRPMPERDLA